MVHTCIKTIMYLRGQMGSTWDQLEQMLQAEQYIQEQAMDQEQEQERDHSGTNSHPTFSTSHLNRHSSLATAQSLEDVNDSDGHDEPSITIPIKSLKEFLHSGERMFVDLEESIYSQLYQLLESESESSHQPELYISLALIFGSSITTPKEQYMIRIGPLEPQQRVHDNPLPSIDKDTHHKQSREEKNWERRLVQQMMGITRIMDDEKEQQQYGQPSVSSFQASPVFTNRTRVHLLKKAPVGLVFQGLLPKQMIVIQEDYSPNDIEARKRFAINSEKSNLTSPGFKKKRWPIHHIHVLGPNTTLTLIDNPLPSNPPVYTKPSLNTLDEIWYQVGQGIPVLSPLL
ncbi:hypothetical protein BGZ76_000702 [Entomortierella beljakovae]|nr:hypothetical protein BGZ76_000702 [Entomortierella beljakovae]